MSTPRKLNAHPAPAPDPSNVEISFGAATHTGTVRQVNEDNWFTAPPVFLVADGMGGHRAGDVASAIVVDTFQEMVQGDPIDASAVEACLIRCHERISRLGNDDSATAPGSTAVVAVYLVEDNADYWLLANVGDSRAYVWTADGFEQISRDHSIVQELIDAGELDPREAASHPERHVITRALGPIQDAPADYSLLPAIAGSKILLCSDGVSSELDDAALARLLDSDADPRAIAESVVAAAIEAGGRDNATAVVVVLSAGITAEDTLGRGLHAVLAPSDTLPGARSQA